MSLQPTPACSHVQAARVWMLRRSRNRSSKRAIVASATERARVKRPSTSCWTRSPSGSKRAAAASVHAATAIGPSSENDTGSTIPGACRSWKQWIRERLSRSSTTTPAAPSPANAQSAQASDGQRSRAPVAADGMAGCVRTTIRRIWSIPRPGIVPDRTAAAARAARAHCDANARLMRAWKPGDAVGGS